MSKFHDADIFARSVTMPQIKFTLSPSGEAKEKAQLAYYKYKRKFGDSVYSIYLEAAYGELIDLINEAGYNLDLHPAELIEALDNFGLELKDGRVIEASPDEASDPDAGL